MQSQVWTKRLLVTKPEEQYVVWLLILVISWWRKLLGSLVNQGQNLVLLTTTIWDSMKCSEHWTHKLLCRMTRPACSHSSFQSNSGYEQEDRSKIEKKTSDPIIYLILFIIIILSSLIDNWEKNCPLSGCQPGMGQGGGSK